MQFNIRTIMYGYLCIFGLQLDENKVILNLGLIKIL